MTAVHPGHAHTEKQHWASGLTVFAGVSLMIVGVLAIMRGIAAIAKDDIFVTTRNYTYAFDLTSWGWIHLALGVVGVIVGIGLFQASVWARVAGVAIAALVIIANFLSLPYYPAWSIVMIAASGFVIWALCVAKKDESFDSSEKPPRAA
ncbi:hypothetical protein ACFVTY_33295 [Streptomyces sp. NPDC058067]|uniref:DUF7144 family membrane protein n=1 Tax=Streptomyces sp. NPDC058067 TaxID=3346324 RepID=UPI0036E26D49